MKEEDLVPTTNDEKEAERVIKNIKSLLGDSGFAQLVEKAHKLKRDYAQLKSSFYSIFSELKNKIAEMQAERYFIKKKEKNKNWINCAIN
nr:P12 family lipoprotein [Borreliella finlandensis]